jgi:hypothetical protein
LSLPVCDVQHRPLFFKRVLSSPATLILSLSRAYRQTALRSTHLKRPFVRISFGTPDLFTT